MKKLGLTLNLSKGFTLIELLVVIAIIGILATIVLTNVQGVRERARDLRRKSDLNSISQSLRLFFTDYKYFPSSSNGHIVGCGVGGVDTCTWGSTFATTTAVYMTRLPLDPQSGTTTVEYYYGRDIANSDRFVLVTKLENKSDSEAAASRSKCASVYPSLYSGTTTAQDYVVCAE